MQNNTVFFEEIIRRLVSTATSAVSLMESVQIGPLNWWQWMVAIFALGLIFSAIRLLAGSTSAPSVSDLGQGSSEVITRFKNRRS